MSRLDELEEMRRRIDAAIEAERRNLWAIAQLRDDVEEAITSSSPPPTATLLAAAAAFNVTQEDLTTAKSGPGIQARQVCMWLLHVQGMSYPQIGRLFGRDHTTAMHAVRRVRGSAELTPIAEDVQRQLLLVGEPERALEAAS